MSSGGEESEEEIVDLSNPDVTTKYMTGAEITQRALQAVIEACKPGADVVELCALGDQLLTDGTAKVYNKKDVKNKTKVEKGIAFPTCISVNEILGHFSPFRGESRQLNPGDVVKVDLACHIDGFIAAAAHTVVLPNAESEPVGDRRADVVHAAWTAAEAALRLVQVGKKNTEVTDMFQKAAGDFECNMMQGVLSHQLKKHVIDGNRVIIGKPTQDEKVDEFEFEANEVYCIDVVVSTGEGKGKETDTRSTVFKRAVENSYGLKTQKARQFISEVNKFFPTLPFTLRAIPDEQVARIGVSESLRHELLHEYPVLKERDGVFVAQFKYTVLLLPGGTKKVTGLPFSQGELVTSQFSPKDEELVALLRTSANPKKSKKKSKKTKDGEEKDDEKADS